ncbi:MAG: MFS transporter [Ruminiclostridium sp.]|nr:MFS transporter [Ruminiclostridium sp.]
MEKKKTNIRALLFCGLLMTITAASDSLRGIFLPEFRKAFALSEQQAGMIIMISYIGNLLFLSVGGRLSDRIPRKRYITGLLIIWCAALLTYVLTENYHILLAGMIFSMGGSTMLSTTVNMMTPLMFAVPAMVVSILNFLQGVGITVSQNIAGRFSDSLGAWHTVNLILLAAAAVCLLLLAGLKLPETEKSEAQEKISIPALLRSPASILLILICGSYFVAEHGLMNWLTSYGTEYLGMSLQDASFTLSLFFGGITVGRLIFAPFIDKIGVFGTLLISSAAGAALYITGMALGTAGTFFIAAAGLALSVAYPLIVMLIGKFFPASVSGSATGLILSIGTLADIGFNAFFGSFVNAVGYGIAMTVMPVSAALFCVLLFTLRFAVRESRNIR